MVAYRRAPKRHKNRNPKPGSCVTIAVHTQSRRAPSRWLLSYLDEGTMSSESRADSLLEDNRGAKNNKKNRFSLEPIEPVAIR